MTARSRGERGSAMVISIMVVVLMTAIGLGMFTFVEGQQRASADERVKDSSFNLAEGAIESAVAYLASSNGWPVSTRVWGTPQGQNTPGTCGPSSLLTDNCPDPDSVDSSFNAVTQKDYASRSWTTTVLDNIGGPCATLSLAGGCHYRESTVNIASTARYDANGDTAVWVRSQATVRGRSRILVSLVKPSTAPSPHPKGVYQGGQLNIATTLNQKVIDTQGSASAASAVRLSCTNPIVPSPDLGTCPGADPNKGQIQPWTLQTGVLLNDCVSPIPSVVVGISCIAKNSDTELNALKARAVAANSYYGTGTCPTAAQLTGKIVFIENKTTGCSYTGGTYNSAASPGMVVLGRGMGLNSMCTAITCLTLTGNAVYYGLIYDTNSSNGGDAFRVGIAGTARVQGAVISDWLGGLWITSTTSPALTYDPAAFGNLTTAGSPKIVQGTYREVPAGS